MADEKLVVISPLEALLSEIKGVLEGDFDGDDCETDGAAMVYDALMVAIDEGFREGYLQGKQYGYVEGFQDGWDEGESER